MLVNLQQIYCCSLQSCSPYVAFWEDYRVSLSSAQCVLSCVFIYVFSIFALQSQYNFRNFSAFILITVKNSRSLKFSLCHLQAFWKWHCLRKLKKNKRDEMRWLWLLRFFNRLIARTERRERKCVLPHNLPDYFSIIVGNIYKHWDLHILILMFMKYIQQTATVNPGLLYLHALLTTFL